MRSILDLWNVRGSDYGVQHPELLGFWTLSIVGKTRKHNVSETGSVPMFRCGGGERERERERERETYFVEFRTKN
jgi:hypothetical protein